MNADGIQRLPAAIVFASQLEAGAFDYAVVAGGLLDFDRLVLGHGRQPLRLGVSGPLDLQAQDLRRLPQPNVLFQRGGPERSAASHGPINRPRFGSVLYGHLDLRADARAVGLDTHQTHADPIVAVSRIFEEPERMGVAGNPATDHFQEVFVSIIIDVGEPHAVAFVQLARAGA